MASVVFFSIVANAYFLKQNFISYCGAVIILRYEISISVIKKYNIFYVM